MTFFDVHERDVISTVFTTYPSRSFTLAGSGSGDGGGYDYDAFEQVFVLEPSGGMPGHGKRTFFDIKGNPIEQNFYSKMRVKLSFNHHLTDGERYTIHRLKNTYASSSFYRPENFSSIATNITSSIHIVTIPNLFIGSGIKPGSFNIQPDSFSVKIYDDGYGGLLRNNKLVGCVFYEYGVALLGEQVTYNTLVGQNTQTVNVYFSATNHVPMNVYICNAPKGLLNFSTNTSYTQLSGTRNEITTTEPATFITTVGLYDEKYELVGVAKVASPILKEEGDSIQFRLKLNF